MNYTIRHVSTESELDDALSFNKKIFAGSTESPEYSRGKWLERMKTHGDLMLYAESDGEVIGIVFGRIENSGNVTVGPVATDERFRKQGIAREMMLLLETRAAGHGIRNLTLGAAESAEEFYTKLGYTGSLLIQSESYGINELLALNIRHRVKYTNVYDGKINQVCLALPAPDRELQRRYESVFPGCYTQMMFEKKI